MLQPSDTASGINLELALKQFSLETERLEMTYGRLQERFKGVQQALYDSHTRLSGKLAELDFISRYLEAILQHMFQGILFIDLQGIVTTYNAAAHHLLQIPEKELLFRPFSDFFDDQFLGFSLHEAFACKRCPRSSLIKWKRQGEELELEVEATFVAMTPQAYPLAHRALSEPSIQGLLVLLRDVTQLRRLQQTAAQNDRLKELGELAAHLAHEIRNPLGGIKGFATLLQQELSDRPDLQQMASYIVEGTNGLSQFVSQVLQYARPMQPHLERVDLVQLIEDLRQLVQVDSKWNSQLSFVIQSPAAKVFAPIDLQLFKSALLNLFVNAAQAMPQGGTLTVSLNADLAWLTLRVQDTGVGIAKENMGRLFSPFFTTKETGTGLGLAEVQKAVQAHQGWIDVQSVVGQGTTFTIKIPLKQSE